MDSHPLKVSPKKNERLNRASEILAAFSYPGVALTPGWRLRCIRLSLDRPLQTTNQRNGQRTRLFDLSTKKGGGINCNCTTTSHFISKTSKNLFFHTHLKLIPLHVPRSDGSIRYANERQRKDGAIKIFVYAQFQ